MYKYIIGVFGPTAGKEFFEANLKGDFKVKRMGDEILHIEYTTDNADVKHEQWQSAFKVRDLMPRRANNTFVVLLSTVEL